MSESNSIQEAAARLAAAQSDFTPCAPVRDLIGEVDLDAAYAVQELVIADRIENGATVVGRKVGLTSRVVQQQLGVSRPDFGVLLDDMVYGTAEPVPLGSLLQPRIEGEIAFVLKRDLESPATTVVDVLRATEFVIAAFEVVASRIEGWDIRITDTIADNASSGAVILGATPYSLTGRDLNDVGMVIEHEGEPVSLGSGAACLGSPVNAVAWLAREVARRGKPLRAGEIVLSGALGPVVNVTKPGRYRLFLSGMGRVDAEFTEQEPAT